MADKKISEMSSHTNANLASGDLIPIVDISEASTSDQNKSLTIGELDKRFQYSGYTAVTTTYTATFLDKVVSGNTSSAAFTITLPSATSNAGKELKIVKANSDLNKLTIDGNGAETIDGNTTIFLLGHQESVTLLSDGTNWIVLNWDEGLDIVTINTWAEENNIDINQLTMTFCRMNLRVKEGITTWSGSAGTAASAAWVLPGSLTIDLTRRGGGGTSVLNHEANRYGEMTYFTTAWVNGGVYYYTSTQVRFSAGGATLLFSNLTAADSVRLGFVEIPVA